VFTVIIYQYNDAPIFLDDVDDIQVEVEDITFHSPSKGNFTINIGDAHHIELKAND
jgi:hypothetical protein